MGKRRVNQLGLPQLRIGAWEFRASGPSLGTMTLAMAIFFDVDLLEGLDACRLVYIMSFLAMSIPHVVVVK